MKYLFTLLFTGIAIAAFGQNVGINTASPDVSASLEIGSTNKGLLIPKVSLTSTSDITTVVGAPYPERLMVYNQATAGNVTPGFYYWDGSEWVRIKVGTEGEDHDWYETGGTAPNNINDNIYTQGNVAIGTTSFSERLSVNGDIYVAGSGGTIGLSNVANGFLRIGSTLGLDPNEIMFDVEGNIGTVGSQSLKLLTNGATRVTIDPSGNLRVGSLASGANGAIVKSNSSGDLTVTNLTGSTGDVLLGDGTFGPGSAFGDNLGNHTATTNLNMTNHQINSVVYTNITAGTGYGVRFWSSDTYKIHMGNDAEYHYGPVTDYSIKTNMSNTTGRGWTWGVVGATPVAAINKDGYMQIAGDLTVAGSDIYMVKGQSSAIHNLGEVSFDWTTGGSYDNAEYHGIQSKNESGAWSDNIRINSYNDIITTLDANNNNATSYFKVQEHSPTDGNDLFWVRSADGNGYFQGQVGIGTTSPRSDTKLDVVGAVGTSRMGVGGTYNSYEVQGIWSIAPNYKISTANNDFGSQYGIVYAHTNAGTSGSKKPISGWGHQILFTSNGTRNAAISLSSGHGYFAGNVGIGTTDPQEKLHVTSNIRADGIVYWGNGLVRTETRNDAGLQGNAGARSGFFETSAPSPAADWPTGASSWWHMIDVRHSNNSNNYALQIAGSFFDQNLYYRKTNNNPAQPWTKIVSGNQGASVYASGTEISLASNNTGSFSYGAGAGWTPGTWQTVSGFAVTRNITSGSTVHITVDALVEGDNYNYYVPSCAYFRVLRGGTEIARTAVLLTVANYVPTSFWYYNSNNLTFDIIDTGVSGSQTYTVQYWLPDEFSSTEYVRLGSRRLNVIELGN